MKILLLSDAHGNKFGLKAVLESGRAYDKILCLGDVVGYGAHPNECCEMLRERDALSLSGNHDAAALGKIDITWFNMVAQTAILWTREQLKEENCSWLDSLPGERVFEEWSFQAVHGSLREPWEEYITDTNVALQTLRLMSQPICFCGHTHQAMLATLSNDPTQWQQFVPIEWINLPDGGQIALNEDELALLNPGSCGQPRDGNAQAKGAIFDVEAQTIEVFCVDYDIEAARSAIINAGLPARLGDRLRLGH